MAQVITLALILLLVGGLSRAQDNPFGVIEGFWLPDLTCDLGPGWERIIFDWAQHQPTGPDDWHTLNVDDRWLKAANRCNREVVAVVKHTPAWATDGLAGPGVPRGLDLPLDDPGNVWANFMRRAAAYYASRGVRRFIIWNEPDITPETYGFEFDGSLDEYYQLLRVGYLAAKQGNPAAVIHLAGTTYWHDVNAGRRLYADRLLERITADPEAAANGYYFDVLTLHIYFRTESVHTIVHQARALLDGYGLADKAIWIGEMNASPNRDPLWPVERPVWQTNLEQQSAFLIQASALALAAGADHIGVYKFYDWGLPPGAESFGLLRADGSRRPAFATWSAVVRRFAGVTGGNVAATEQAAVVRLQRADNIDLVVAWARTAEPAQIGMTAVGNKAHLLDEYGGIIGVHPFRGAYRLNLPGATCNRVDGCAVGGAPVVLLQAAGEVSIHEITADGPVPLLLGEESPFHVTGE